MNEVNGWAIVSGDFVPHGGMDRANLELALFLASEQPVHLVTHRAADELVNLPNVTIHRVARPLGKHLLGQPLLGRAGRRWGARLAREGFRVIVNGGNCRWPDVNWVHYLHSAYQPNVQRSALRWLKAKIDRPLALRAERAAIRAARVVICNSDRTRNDVIDKLGVEPHRAVTIYYGTDPDQFPLITSEDRATARARLGWDDRPRVVFIGALGDTRKGFDTLYAAWGELCRESGWDADLTVAGTGAALNAWRERAAADGLASRIGFLGFRTDVPDILAASDLFVHPARYEAYGLAPHEALCRGLPAIVSAIAGVSERYPRELTDLILTDPDSPAELATCLRHWRANQESLAARVRPLADALRSRTWTDMARDIRDAILTTE